MLQGKPAVGDWCTLDRIDPYTQKRQQYDLTPLQKTDQGDPAKDLDFHFLNYKVRNGGKQGYRPRNYYLNVCGPLLNGRNAVEYNTDVDGRVPMSKAAVFEQASDRAWANDTGTLAHTSYIITSPPPLFQNGLQVKSGFEMCFDIGSRHLGCWGQITSQIQNKEVCATLCLQASIEDNKLVILKEGELRMKMDGGDSAGCPGSKQRETTIFNHISDYYAMVSHRNSVKYWKCCCNR